ncbi:MAG TPA: hypothetical protein VGS13_02775, partial [Stellaceae bacterium]|nr:hypothetical protein [Stellaceae bacterium]
MGAKFVTKMLIIRRWCKNPAVVARSLARTVAAGVGVWALAGNFLATQAQDNAAQENARREAVLARLPHDAAKRAFGLAT